jgi:hypothetical protein
MFGVVDFDDVDGDAAWWIAAHAVTHLDKDECDVCCYLGLDCVEVDLLTVSDQGQPRDVYPSALRLVTDPTRWR